MDKRLALVVDDSRSARETLKRMLEQHNLAVDTLDSATGALEYLKHHTPDVIFMDHMMPGMDGFQAVEAIKGNPDTATIPIMMYTSKEGDLYVSQARALGAMGILPKQVQPAELFEVLSKLGLVRERRIKATAESRFVLLDPPQEVALSAAREQITEIANAAARSVQAHHSTPAQLAEQLERYHQEMLENLHELRSRLDQENTAAQQHSSAALPLLAVALMLIPLLWIYQHGASTRDALDQSNQRIEQLRSEEHQQVSSKDSESAALREQLQHRDTNQRMQAAQVYDSIAWALNQHSAYDMRQDAFGDARLAQLQELVSRLSALGFHGIIQLESHLGEFCLAGNDSAGLKLAAPDTPVTECDTIGNPQQQLPDAGVHQSIAFANFLSTSPLLARGDIRIEVVPFLFSRPRIAYPPQQSDVNARDWNRIAAANNRIEIRLLPDAE
jgi:CheY-like chemotaxis protein